MFFNFETGVMLHHCA